jgi:hypothetical protein
MNSRWCHLNAANAVIPAKAGIHVQVVGNTKQGRWIPAFAGMTALREGLKHQLTPVPQQGINNLSDAAQTITNFH